MPAATAVATPSLMRLFVAVSTDEMPGPLRLMFATAGSPAAWSAITQSMPAMIVVHACSAVAAEDTHGHEVHVLGNAVGCPADRARDVRAVAVAVDAVLAVADEVRANARAATELLVRREDAGVDDVRRDARSGALVQVGATERERVLVDAVEAPGRARLGVLERDLGVGLDERDLRVPRRARPPRLPIRGRRTR